MEENIKNITEYNNRMRSSLLDKAFFLDKIDTNSLVVDFGCADGSLISFMYGLNPGCSYIGYDISQEMLDVAQTSICKQLGVDQLPDNIKLYSDWNLVQTRLEQDKRSAVLVLSSVIHEVYSYGSEQDVRQFWYRVFTGWFKYVVIRDMLPRRTIDRASNASDELKVRTRASSLPDESRRLAEFENIWGSIASNKNLLHYLLKYRYVTNWDREVRENYLPLSLEDLQEIIPYRYSSIYWHEYLLPFTHEQVKRDFKIDIKNNIQLQAILKCQED